MKTFVTSDTHFGHHNIIRYCGRPFRKTGQMDAAMIENWNTRVSDDDIVYFLGDFAMGPRVNESFIRRILASLNGEKRIVLGNHDQPNRKHKQIGLKAIVYDDANISILEDIHEEQIDGTYFVMCHYPMSDWNGRFHGSIQLHGHVHSTIITPTQVTGTMTQWPNGKWSQCKSAAHVDNRYDVGVDMYGGPVQLTGDLRYLKDPRGWE